MNGATNRSNPSAVNPNRGWSAAEKNLRLASGSFARGFKGITPISPARQRQIDAMLAKMEKEEAAA